MQSRTKEFEYVRFKIAMSGKKLADVMYAILITQSKLTSSLGIGVYQYTRQQNARNMVNIICAVPTDKVALFKEITGAEFEDFENPRI